MPLICVSGGTTLNPMGNLPLHQQSTENGRATKQTVRALPSRGARPGMLAAMLSSVQNVELRREMEVIEKHN